MAAPIEFNIKILGGAPGELAKTSEGFKKTEESAKKAGEGVKVFEGEVGKLGGSIGGLSLDLSGKGSLITFDLAEGIKSAIELVEHLAEKFYDLGKEIVNVAGETQDLDLAINLKVGREGAEDLDVLAEKFRGRTRYNPEAIKRAMLPLLDLTGLRGQDELKADLVTIAADLEARSGGKQKLADTLEGIAGVAKRGRIKPGMLASLGIETNDYFAALAATLKVDIGTAEKMAKKGKVDSKIALQTLVNVVGAKEGGAIGGAALAGGETLGATLARLGDLPTDLFRRLSDSPGMKSVQRVLDTFVNVLGGPVGTKVITKIGDVFEQAFGRISSSQIVEFLEKVPGYVQAGIDGVKGFLHVLGEMGDAVDESKTKTPMEIIFRLWGKLIDEAGEHLFLKAKDIGRNLAEGIKEGFLGVSGEEGEGFFSWKRTVQRYKDILGIHSPSTVFMEIGAFSAEGFARGVEAGGGRVNDAAARSLVSNAIGPVEPLPSLPGGAPSPAGGVPPMTNHFHFPNVREPAEAAQLTRIELEKLLYRAGLALGVPA